jgi:hypothetical protein
MTRHAASWNYGLCRDTAHTKSFYGKMSAVNSNQERRNIRCRIFKWLAPE